MSATTKVGNGEPSVKVEALIVVLIEAELVLGLIVAQRQG